MRIAIVSTRMMLFVYVSACYGSDDEDDDD